MQTTTTTTVRRVEIQQPPPVQVIETEAPVVQVIEVDEGEAARDYYCFRLTSQVLDVLYLAICCQFLVRAESR